MPHVFPLLSLRESTVLPAGNAAAILSSVPGKLPEEVNCFLSKSLLIVVGSVLASVVTKPICADCAFASATNGIFSGFLTSAPS